MILICYDGSHDARAAIERGAELIGDEPVTVLTVWEPLAEVLARTSISYGMIAGMVDQEEIDERSRISAQERADEGARVAREAGLAAETRIFCQETTVADAILSEAAAIGATAIVIGTRGLTGLKSRLLGSVSRDVLQHADRPVLLVPSAEVADARRKGREDSQA